MAFSDFICIFAKSLRIIYRLELQTWVRKIADMTNIKLCMKKK